MITEYKIFYNNEGTGQENYTLSLGTGIVTTLHDVCYDANTKTLTVFSTKDVTLRISPTAITCIVAGISLTQDSSIPIENLYQDLRTLASEHKINWTIVKPELVALPNLEQTLYEHYREQSMRTDDDIQGKLPYSYADFVGYEEDVNPDAEDGSKDLWLESRTSYIWKVGTLVVIDGNKCDYASVVLGIQRDSDSLPEVIGTLDFKDGENTDIACTMKRFMDNLLQAHHLFRTRDW